MEEKIDEPDAAGRKVVMMCDVGREKSRQFLDESITA